MITVYSILIGHPVKTFDNGVFFWILFQILQRIPLKALLCYEATVDPG